MYFESQLMLRIYINLFRIRRKTALLQRTGKEI